MIPKYHFFFWLLCMCACVSVFVCGCDRQHVQGVNMLVDARGQPWLLFTSDIVHFLMFLFLRDSVSYWLGAH